MTNTLETEANPTVDEILDAARELVPRLRERSAETERLRHLPEATMQEALDAKLFNLLVPKSLGGAGGGAHESVAMGRILARGDMGAAWALTFLVNHVWMCLRWPAAAQDDLFANGAIPRLSMSGRPKGPAIAVPTDGGYLLTGHWGYATGIMDATWYAAPGKIEGAPTAPPGQLDLENQHLFMMPRDEVSVIDTWETSGMRATGSQDVKVEGLFVPEHRTMRFPDFNLRQNPGTKVHDDAVVGYSLADLMVFVFPAMATGAAEVMVEEYRERLDKHRAAFDPRLSGDTEAGQIRYAKAVSALRVAQTMLEQTVDESTAQSNAEPGEKSAEVQALRKLDCVSVVSAAVEVFDLVARGSGTSIFRSADSTQQYLRDMQMLISHVSIDPDGMQQKAGRILLDRATENHPAQIFV